MSSPLSESSFARFVRLDRDEQERLLRLASPADILRFDAHYEHWVHEGQIEPRQEGWRTWLMMAGRGYGKTRAGAEWIHRLAMTCAPARIALVGASADEVRSVMIEGESGILRVAGKRRPKWEPSLGRLTWRSGAQAFVYSAENPDGLRGPQHDFAWCDELAKWAYPEATWDNLQMGMRNRDRARTLVTTTPRPIPLLKKIEAARWTVTTRGRTSDNASLPESFVAMMMETYGGTRLGRQELDGEIVADLEGALWSRGTIEACRVAGVPPMRRVVIGVDPPASKGGDACGIIAAGVSEDKLGFVLGDHSVSGLSPEGWARAVADAAAAHGADLVVAEANNGGDMVRSVLEAADSSLPVRLVHASQGKAARAEPVAMLFERGRARFVGAYPALEDELAGLAAGGAYRGPGRSPDRADAMVWALSALMLGGKASAEPRVRGL